MHARCRSGSFTRTLLVALTAASCAAGEPAERAGSELWSHSFTILEDLAYGDDPAQKLDLYLQGRISGEPNWFERAPDARPTLVHIHGGGWRYGDKTAQVPWILPFLERGWNVAAITYRMGPGTAPAAVEDAVCALRWVVANAAEYGLDRQRIVLSGESAGAHLALMAGMLGSREGHPCNPGDGFRAAAIVNWFGITDLGTLEAYLAREMPDVNYALTWAGSEERVAELSPVVSPMAVVGTGAPPVITVHGEIDTIVPYAQATSFHDRLTELGVTNELIPIAGGNHGGFTAAQFQAAYQAIFAFLGPQGL